ncbi:DNA primase (plasmid) [Nostoc flagelliforme CCNUN1]|uniref:DNA primase n=1 Tax=Nostoc flagelliforme CCNUN1 TaxID=2038116 RepID=A0A2K8T620_9NOSO|nr:hypothetical protein [Nostoc flagelliforme]AUB43070.1 DNA primase [Nostoc flagelliforme CCNUN1]
MSLTPELVEQDDSGKLIRKIVAPGQMITDDLEREFVPPPTVVMEQSKSKRGALPKRGDCTSSSAATTEKHYYPAVRPRANLPLVAKAVGVANGELIKNRFGTSKLIYFQYISGKQIVPYVSKININLDPMDLMINRFVNFFASSKF